jgi:hypothetical protein
MAITAADKVRILGPAVGGRTPIVHLLRATSVAVKRGDAIAIASGKGAAAASTVVATTFGGFAADPETASSGTSLTIVPARPGIRFMAKINTASSSSKLLQKHMLAKAAIKKYTSSSVNVFTLDPNLSSSSGKSFVAIITRLVSAVSTVNGWAEFEIRSGDNKNTSGYSLW